MTDSLKLKNAIYAIIFYTSFISFVWILMCGICVSGSYFAGQAKDIKWELIIFGGLLAGTWLVALLCILFHKTVIVTATEIKMLRRGKMIWSIEKEKIIQCVYKKVKWYFWFLSWLSTDMFALHFRIEGGYLKEHCLLSYKQVKMIQEKFNYPVKIS